MARYGEWIDYGGTGEAEATALADPDVGNELALARTNHFSGADEFDDACELTGDVLDSNDQLFAGIFTTVADHRELLGFDHTQRYAVQHAFASMSLAAQLDGIWASLLDVEAPDGATVQFDMGPVLYNPYLDDDVDNREVVKALVTGGELDLNALLFDYRFHSSYDDEGDPVDYVHDDSQEGVVLLREATGLDPGIPLAGADLYDLDGSDFNTVLNSVTVGTIIHDSLLWPLGGSAEVWTTVLPLELIDRTEYAPTFLIHHEAQQTHAAPATNTAPLPDSTTTNSSGIEALGPVGEDGDIPIVAARLLFNRPSRYRFVYEGVARWPARQRRRSDVSSVFGQRQRQTAPVGLQARQDARR